MRRKRDAIIVDIDGTLANNSHRQHFLEKKPKNWDGFFKAETLDVPNRWCVEIIERFQNVEVLLVSGRPSELSAQRTLEWLRKHKVQHSKLIMRPAGDHRDDDVVKREIYQKLIEPHYNVLFTVDDRRRVVDMWRSLGLTCLQCAPGEF